MRIYDVVVVLKGSLPEVDQKKVFKTVKDLLKDTKITKEEEWGEKTLAYPIKHEKTGIYLSMTIEGQAIPTDFEKKMITNEQVIRHLVVRRK